MNIENESNDEFAFQIIEQDGDKIVIEVSEADYEREIAAGVDEETLLKPGRHTFIRGGFRKRHPDFDPKTAKTLVTVSLKVDLEVLNYFQQKAESPDSPAYQDLMREALRQIMGQEIQATSMPLKPQPQKTDDYSVLLNDERFISAVTEQVMAQIASHSTQKRLASEHNRIF